MAQLFSGKKRIRKHFGKMREVAEMPNLIEVQKSSYELFLNSGDESEPKQGEGIMGVFQSVFPVKDYNDTSILEFVSYELVIWFVSVTKFTKILEYFSNLTILIIQLRKQ